MSYLDSLLDRIVVLVPCLLSLTVHEWAHAWTAWRLGDDTAKMLGRVSLNPLDHIDPVGTLLLPLLGVPFGWAKPVPINPVRFRTSISMPMGLLLTAAAGPLSNLLLAAGSWAVLAVLSALMAPGLAGGVEYRVYAVAAQFLQLMFIINVAIACFNLLPVPPLDGSRIVDALVPYSLRPHWSRFVAAGPVILLVIILWPILMGWGVWPALLRWVSGLLH